MKGSERLKRVTNPILTVQKSVMKDTALCECAAKPTYYCQSVPGHCEEDAGREVPHFVLSIEHEDTNSFKLNIAKLASLLRMPNYVYFALTACLHCPSLPLYFMCNVTK